jgi:hypothetical protein
MGGEEEGDGPEVEGQPHDPAVDVVTVAPAGEAGAADQDRRERHLGCEGLHRHQPIVTAR